VRCCFCAESRPAAGGVDECDFVSVALREELGTDNASVSPDEPAGNHCTDAMNESQSSAVKADETTSLLLRSYEEHDASSSVSSSRTENTIQLPLESSSSDRLLSPAVELQDSKGTDDVVQEENSTADGS